MRGFLWSSSALAWNHVQFVALQIPMMLIDDYEIDLTARSNHEKSINVTDEAFTFWTFFWNVFCSSLHSSAVETSSQPRRRDRTTKIFVAQLFLVQAGGAGFG